MPGSPFAQLLGDSSFGKQYLTYTIFGALVSPLLEPITTQLADEIWSAIPSRPLSPAEAAEARLKGIMSEADAEAEGKRSGVDAGRMDTLYKITGEPLSPRDALEALRRGKIPEDSEPGGAASFMEAVRQSRLHPKWGPVLQALQWLPLPPSDAVDAVVEGQIDYGDGEAAAKISGVTAEDFRILVNTRGRPPSPTELAELYRRGFIPREGTGPDALSFQQGIFEGATKNKWWQLFAHLADYIPPPRTVTALLREDAITKDQAAALFKQSGLSDDLAAAYVKSASHAKVQKARDLALATVLDLYEAHAITEKEAHDFVSHLGYDEHETAYLLVLHDLQRQLKAVRAAIERVGNLYITRKIDAKATTEALDALGLTAAHRDELMAVWDLERRKTVKVLTPAQIAAAVYYKVLPFDEGVKKLVADGYTEDDARIVIDVRLHGIPGAHPAGQ